MAIVNPTMMNNGYLLKNKDIPPFHILPELIKEIKLHGAEGAEPRKKVTNVYSPTIVSLNDIFVSCPVV